MDCHFPGEQSRCLQKLKHSSTEGMSDTSIRDGLITALTSSRWPMRILCQTHTVSIHSPVLQRAADEGWWWSGAAGTGWQCWMKYKVQTPEGVQAYRGDCVLPSCPSSPPGFCSCVIDPPQGVQTEEREKRWRSSSRWCSKLNVQHQERC